MDGFDFEPDLPKERLATVGDSKTDKRIVCRYGLEGRECFPEGGPVARRLACAYPNTHPTTHPSPSQAA